MKICFICGRNSEFSKTRKVGRYKYLFCEHCGGATLTPRNKVIRNIEKIYSEDYFRWDTPKGARKLLYPIYLYKNYSDWVGYKDNIGVKRLLDIGAGTAEFVSEMKDRGWDAYALELSFTQSRKIARAIGIRNVYRGYFENANLPANYFDALTFWHVLEHLKLPYEAIKKARRILKKGGKLYLEVPNVESLTWSLFGDYYDLIRIPEHLSYFSGKSLKILLKENKFKILEIDYPLKLNSAFATSFSKYVKTKTDSSGLANISFYFCLPLSFASSFIGSLVGRSEIIRVCAKKID